jgi:hypothetical protein
LKQWNAKGFFGFLYYKDPDGWITDVFVHRVNFWPGHKPVVGAQFEFELGPGRTEEHRDQAIKVKQYAVNSGVEALAKQATQGGTQ